MAIAKKQPNKKAMQTDMTRTSAVCLAKRTAISNEDTLVSFNDKTPNAEVRG
jgi:hypothetical protein